MQSAESDYKIRVLYGELKMKQLLRYKAGQRNTHKCVFYDQIVSHYSPMLCYLQLCCDPPYPLESITIFGDRSARQTISYDIN